MELTRAITQIKQTAYQDDFIAYIIQHIIVEILQYTKKNVYNNEKW